MFQNFASGNLQELKPFASAAFDSALQDKIETNHHKQLVP